MTTKDIYNLSIKLGKEADLRGIEKVEKYLKRINKKFDSLTDDKKEFFDTEKLTNPYSDSRVLFDSGKAIKKIMAGIDMETPELLLAKQMGDIDLVLSHHPEGLGLSGIPDTMHMQAEVLANYGIPINIAESVIKPRISEVNRGVAPANHDRAVMAAKTLGIDYMCMHTPADNMSAKFVINLLEENKEEIETVGDIIEILSGVPEYKEARKNQTGPTIFAGSEENSCGKILVTEFSGGTSGSKDIYEKMSQYGVGTVIGMHMSEEHRKEAEKYHINVVVAGHMASDSLGMNLLLDEIEKKGIEVVPASGLIRVKRF
jgi:putative NIF3 family GTP cyclohydrolase 1 type 2